MIQLPLVIAVIAQRLANEIVGRAAGVAACGLGAPWTSTRGTLDPIGRVGAEIRTPSSGYLQVDQDESLVKIADVGQGASSTCRYRPVHFLVAAQVMARARPADAATLRRGETWRAATLAGTGTAPWTQAKTFGRTRPARRDSPCARCRRRSTAPPPAPTRNRLDRPLACAGSPHRGGHSGILTETRTGHIRVIA